MSDFVNITRNNNDIISTYTNNQMDEGGDEGIAGLVTQLAEKAQQIGNPVFVETFPIIAPETDDSGRVGRAITQANNTNSPLIWDNKTYNLSTNFTLTKSLNWFGRGGWGGTKINFTGTGTLFTFTLVGAMVCDIEFDGNNTQTLLNLNGSFQMFFERCKITGGNPGIKFTGNSGDNHFSLCSLTNNQLAVLVDSQINYFNNCNFSGNDISVDSTPGATTNGLRLSQCTFVGGLNKLNPSVWVTGTAYSIGSIVTSNGNIYQCTTAGTSGATAPSGTGTGISDGGATWAYREATTSAINKATVHVRKQSSYGFYSIEKCWFEGCLDAIDLENGYGSTVKESYVAASRSCIKTPGGSAVTLDTNVTSGEQSYTPNEYTYGATELFNINPRSILGYHPSVVGATGTETILSKREGFTIPYYVGDFVITNGKLQASPIATNVPSIKGVNPSGTTANLGELWNASTLAWHVDQYNNMIAVGGAISLNHAFNGTMASGSALNSSLFVDSADNKLKWKNSSGVITILAT